MRNERIYIKTKKHVIRMCPRTGVFDAVPSRTLYFDKLEYRYNDGHDTFERLFRYQFAMSGCADEILEMFYTMVGIWLNPESDRTNVAIISGISNDKNYMKNIMGIFSGCRHGLYSYEREADFKYYTKNIKIDFAFRTCPIPDGISYGEWRTVLDNERELENIQFKAIRALSNYIRNGGFKQPEYCLTALKNLTTDDHMDRYINEMFIIKNGSDVYTEANKAYDNYCEWHFANEIKERCIGKRMFNVTLREMGFRVDRNNNVYRISGVLLKNQRTNNTLTSFTENSLIT